MPQEAKTKEVRVRALAPVSPESCVLVLEELGGARLLPIFAARCDGEAIARQVAGLTAPRPLTHDLLLKLVGALGGTVRRVVIHDVKDGTFFAQIDVGWEGGELEIDARPSDAVNVALRAGAPIFVAEHVFAEGDALLKPIEDEERRKFAEDLATLDVGKAFDELEGKPAPKEPGREAAS